MALLLDDEDVLVMARSSPQPTKTSGVVHMDVDGDDDRSVKEPEVAVGTTTRGAVINDVTPVKGDNSPDGTDVRTPSPIEAASHRGDHSPSSAGADVTLSRRGGNGLAKMEALMFGKPRVTIVHGGGTGRHNESGADISGRKRSAQEALGASTPMHTPLAQKTSAAQAASNGSTNSTQPKVVSAARSSLSASSVPLLQDQTPCASLHTPRSTPRDMASPSASSASPEQLRGSLLASPPARPPLPVTQPSPQPTQPAAEAAATQPAKTQMKLSAFFSKMACKR